MSSLIAPAIGSGAEACFKIVVSDFHVGSGHTRGTPNPWDEFSFDSRFSELLTYYSTGKYADADVELIINGDFFDLLKIAVNGEWPIKITGELAAEKVRKCLEGHTELAEGLRNFVSRPGKRVTYVPGNHDQDFLFEAAQRVFADIIGGDKYREKIKFYAANEVYELPGGIMVTHGHQFEVNNSYDYAEPFVTKTLAGAVDDPFLKLPWGSLFVMQVINPLKVERPYVDRVSPFWLFVLGGMLLDFRFTLKMILRASFYFITSRLMLILRGGGNPARALKTAMESIIFFPTLEANAERMLRNHKHIHTIIMGHDHNPRCRVFPDGTTYVNTGSWTQHVSLDIEHFGKNPGLHYCLIEYPAGGRPLATLMKWQGHTAPFEAVNY